MTKQKKYHIEITTLTQEVSILMDNLLNALSFCVWLVPLNTLGPGSRGGGGGQHPPARDGGRPRHTAGHQPAVPLLSGVARDTSYCHLSI